MEAKVDDVLRQHSSMSTSQNKDSPSPTVPNSSIGLPEQQSSQNINEHIVAGCEENSDRLQPGATALPISPATPAKPESIWCTEEMAPQASATIRRSSGDHCIHACKKSPFVHREDLHLEELEAALTMIGMRLNTDLSIEELCSEPQVMDLLKDNCTPSKMLQAFGQVYDFL
ncbi:hypothetical protein ACLMJK_001897 [Lecanora helva]